MTNAYAGLECDQGGCPAAWLRAFVLHGQDFRFCEHHAREIDIALGHDAAPLAPPADAEPAATAAEESDLVFATSW